MMQRILVTGANKGIGLALVEKILEREGTFVFLGSRDRHRGDVAAAGVVERNPSAAGRVSVLDIDVTSDASVAAAAARVASEGPLFGLVLNAGGFLDSATATFELNLYSQKRTTDAFRGLMDASGSRIVFLSSGAGPMTAAKCSPAVLARLTRRDAAWADVDSLAREFLACSSAPAAAAAGFPDPADPWASYGLSKALLNTWVHAKAGGLSPTCRQSRPPLPSPTATDTSSPSPPRLRAPQPDSPPAASPTRARPG